MRSTAFVLMVLGWLIHGSMPAFAGCGPCAGMTDIAKPEAAHHHDAAERSAPSTAPCADGGMTHMPFCAACTVLPAMIAVDTGNVPRPGYPVPALARVLRAVVPAPQAPPPRSA